MLIAMMIATLIAKLIAAKLIAMSQLTLYLPFLSIITYF
jgi:hypothetical protein